MLDSRYDAIIAKPTASDSGTNSDRAAPCMKNDETNTARMHSIANNRGTAVSARAIQHGLRDRVGTALHLRVDVLDLDRRLVDQNADRQRQAAQRHQVDRLPGDPQRQHGSHQRQRNVEHDDQRASPVAQEQTRIIRPDENRAEQPFASPRRPRPA